MRDLPTLLRPGDALVVNDSKVVPARMYGHKRKDGGQGAKIEILLLKALAPDCYRVLARPAKRLSAGDRIDFGGLDAEVLARGERGEVDLRFDRSGERLNDLIGQLGEMPLPQPYIAGKRAGGRARCHRFSDRLCPGGGLGGSPHCGAALHG